MLLGKAKGTGAEGRADRGRGPVAAAVAARVAVLAAAGLLLSASIGGCGDDGGTNGPKVIATTGILADVAQHVTGPDAEVAQLIPDNADPHSFSLSAQDRQELEQADLVVANGAGLEAGVPLAESGAEVWELTANAGDLLTATPGEEAGATDPHVWMDPTRVAGAMPSLAAALGDADPAHARDYEERAERYARELRSLDREIARTLAGVPAENREIVTSHDALGYFAHRYGFEVTATVFPATGAEAEASAKRLGEVEAAVRQSGVPAIFVQSVDDPEALSIVADETGVELEDGLAVESPGAAGGYAEMLRLDAQLVADGLGG
jgi:zinc/manganese transport system substrate-binding protein